MSLPVEIPAGGGIDRSWRLARAAALVVLVVALPYLLATYQLGQLTSALILAIAVVGLNLLSGFAGQISLGHAAFMGIGAYTTAVMLDRWESPVVVTLAVGVVLCFVVGFVVGLPALRLQGMYLALVTLSVGVMFPSLVRRFHDLTGGSSGIFGMRFEPPEMAYFAGRAGQTVWLYYVVVVALVLSCAVVWNIMHGRIGRAIVALRDHEAGAAVMGVNRAIVRTVVFGISAAIAGLAGGLFAVNTGVLTPDTVGLLLTINLIVAMVIGGRASFWGPVFGGLAIYYIPDWSSDLGQGPIAGVFFGVVVILLVFVLPGGISGGLNDLLRRIVVIVPQRPDPDPTAVERRTATRDDDRPTGGARAAADPSLGAPLASQPTN